MDADWREAGRRRYWDLPSEVYDPARNRLLSRIRRDMQVMSRTELETRRILAEEVYGVPETWLDEVLRVRLADLPRI